MVYSDTENFLGIVQDIDFLVHTNSTTYTLANKTRNSNRAVDRAVTIIMQADGRWKYDDSNYTNLPIARGNLVSGQREYSVLVAHLKVLGISIKDSNGDFRKLVRIPNSAFSQDEEERHETDGTPVEYGLTAN